MTFASFALTESICSAALSLAASAGARACDIEYNARSRGALGFCICGALAAAVLFAAGAVPHGGASLAILVAAVSVCAAGDAATGFVFDTVTLPVLALLIAAAYAGGTIQQAVLGACVAAGCVLSIYAATRGRGIGLGDAKLAACIGAGLGARVSLYALGIAFVSGACAGVTALALRRASRGTEMRFAPYLAAGTVLAALLQPL